MHAGLYDFVGDCQFVWYRRIQCHLKSAWKNKIDKAKASSAFSFWGCLFIGLLYVLTIFLFKDLTIDLLGGKDAEVHAYADTYLLWAVEIGGIVTILNSFFGHLFRSEGKSFLAGFGIILGGILNILLDPLFMFVIFEKAMKSWAPQLQHFFPICWQSFILSLS